MLSKEMAHGYSRSLSSTAKAKYVLRTRNPRTWEARQENGEFSATLARPHLK